MTTVEGKRLYGRWPSELWNGDLAVAEEVLARDFVSHWPGAPAKVRGPQALAQVVGENRGCFTDLRVDACRFVEYRALIEQPTPEVSG